MFKPRSLGFVMACAMVFAAPATAQDTHQETAGTITGILAAQEVSWSFSARQSDFTGDAQMGTVSIGGWPDKLPEGLAQAQISFDLVEGKATNPEVSVWQKGSETVLFGKEGSVNLTDITIEGDILTLSGSVTAFLGETTDYGRNVDMGNRKAVSLTFDGQIARLDF